MSMDGVLDIYLVEGSLNGNTFMDFVQRTLLLYHFDGENERSMVMLDNASIHYIDPVVEAIKCWSIS